MEKSMTIRSLAEVRARLEEAVNALPEGPTPLAQYECYEMIAIEMLDSEFELYQEGLLEDYLKVYLHLKRLELGVDEADLG